VIQVGDVRTISVDGDRQLELRTVNTKPLIFGLYDLNHLVKRFHGV